MRFKKNSGNILFNKKKISKPIYSYYFSGDLLGEDDMTIKENILYNIELNENTISEEYQKLIGIFELQNYENTLYKHASEGMKQKTHIIICLLYKKLVTILDEPFNYLDENSHKEFVRYLLENYKNSNKIVVIATNELIMLDVLDGKVLYLKSEGGEEKCL